MQLTIYSMLNFVTLFQSDAHFSSSAVTKFIQSLTFVQSSLIYVISYCIKRVVQGGGGCHGSRAEKLTNHEYGDYGCLQRFLTVYKNKPKTAKTDISIGGPYKIAI